MEFTAPVDVVVVRSDTAPTPMPKRSSLPSILPRRAVRPAAVRAGVVRVSADTETRAPAPKITAIAANSATP